MSKLPTRSYQTFGSAIYTSAKYLSILASRGRTDAGWTTIKTNSKLVAKEILRCADIVFATCVNVASKWLREFRHEYDVVFLAEGGCITEADALIRWKGPKLWSSPETQSRLVLPSC